MNSNIPMGLSLANVPLDRALLLLGAQSRAVQAAVNDADWRIRAETVALFADTVTLLEAGIPVEELAPPVDRAKSALELANQYVSSRQALSRGSFEKDPQYDCDVLLLGWVLTKERELLLEVKQTAVKADLVLRAIPGAQEYGLPRAPTADLPERDWLERGGKWQAARSPVSGCGFRMSWTPRTPDDAEISLRLPSVDSRANTWAQALTMQELVAQARAQGSRRPLGTLERELNQQMQLSGSAAHQQLRQWSERLVPLLSPLDALAQRMAMPLAHRSGERACVPVG